MVLTFFFAQFLGLLMVVIAASLLLQRRMYLSMIAEYHEKRAYFYPHAFTGLVVGLLLVLLHNVWSGGFLPVLVTVLGWAILIKSAGLLVLAPGFIDKMLVAVHSRRTYTILAIIMLVLGIYLFLAGAGGR